MAVNLRDRVAVGRFSWPSLQGCMSAKLRSVQGSLQDYYSIISIGYNIFTGLQAYLLFIIRENIYIYRASVATLLSPPRVGAVLGPLNFHFIPASL